MTSGDVTLRGTVLPDGTLQLPGAVGLPPGPVEVVVRSAQPETKKETLLELMARIDKEREAIVGYKPRTAEEVDAYLRELREEWEERDAEIEAIHAARARSGEMPPTEPAP